MKKKASKSSRPSEEELDRLTADAELWEMGQLGASFEYAQPASDEEQRQIDEGLGLQLISMRLNKSLIEQFKQLADLEGIGYQPLMRHVLTSYATQNEHKLDRLLKPEQAAKKAEQQLDEAMTQAKMIERSCFEPGSKERIDLEREHARLLSHAYDLFVAASKQPVNPVLKRHIEMRIGQIQSMCGDEPNRSAPQKWRQA
jgi:hypothetical protein